MSAAPGRIIEDLRINLPRPRSTDMASSTEYISARQFCLDTISRKSAKPLGGPKRMRLIAAVSLHS
jgi:NitT/TauT family transport system ATP-binding protein